MDSEDVPAGSEVDFDTEFTIRDALVPRHQPTEVERQATWNRSAADLIEQYAGFTDAESLTDQEKIVALLSLVPMALNVVEEARDTIERLNTENEDMRWRLDGLEK